MYLRSIHIENFRAIREGRVTFDRVSVLYGENDSGRSSIIEALGLILGAPEDVFEHKLKPHHFHRSSIGVSGPMVIRLRLAETVPAEWKLPACMARVFPAEPNRSRELEFVFRAELQESGGAIAYEWRIEAPVPDGASLKAHPDMLVWLRDISPVLWIHPGQLTQPVARAAGADRAMMTEHSLLATLERHHRNLVLGTSTDLMAELDQGARAAHEILKTKPRVFGSAGPLMSAMASDILNRAQIDDAGDGPANTAAQKIAVLLLLGAIVQLARRNLSEGSNPVLIIENPEANLHPMTSAAVWRILERIVLQKIVATNSGTILANAPLGAIRRITRTGAVVTEWQVRPRQLSKEALRRISYHLRSRRASAMFARCWLLVEGETEYWVLPELARVCGYDLAAEGVACVEFAQCGLSPLTRMADQLGIAWHVLADGDDAGQHYQDAALKAMKGGPRRSQKATRLRERDIEHCFWRNGFSDVIQRVAYRGAAVKGGAPSAAIRKAIEKTSKPYLALSLIEAAAERGPASVPAVLRGVIESCVRMARVGPEPGTHTHG